MQNEYICEYQYEGKTQRIYIYASSFADADAHLKAISQSAKITAKVEAKFEADAELARKLFPLTSKRKAE